MKILSKPNNQLTVPLSSDWKNVSRTGKKGKKSITTTRPKYIVEKKTKRKLTYPERND